jgi:hypothetical protein
VLVLGAVSADPLSYLSGVGSTLVFALLVVLEVFYRR